MTQWFVYIPAGFFFQVEFFEVNFRWNFAVNPFRFIAKISTWKKIPGGKICIFRLILLLYIAFHLYSISCEGEKKSTSIFFLRFHVFKFTSIPAGHFVQVVLNLLTEGFQWFYFREGLSFSRGSNFFQECGGGGGGGPNVNFYRNPYITCDFLSPPSGSAHA